MLAACPQSPGQGWSSAASEEQEASLAPSIWGFRLHPSVLSVLLMAYLPPFLWLGGGEGRYPLETGRGRLWSPLLGHFFLYGLSWESLLLCLYFLSYKMRVLDPTTLEDEALDVTCLALSLSPLCTFSGSASGTSLLSGCSISVHCPASPRSPPRSHGMPGKCRLHDGRAGVHRALPSHVLTKHS